MTVFEARRKRLGEWMAREGVALAVFEDFEGRRDPSLRWLSGHPGDALLFLSADNESFLVAWDFNMARVYAHVDMVIPYGQVDRQPINALQLAAMDFFKIPLGARIEIPALTPYPVFLQYVEAMNNFDIICRNNGLQETAQQMRAVKDEEEIRIYRKAADITNTLIDLLEENVRSGNLKTETDVALFIETESRSRGADGTGFETLAAGPERSFGIHAFPSYTGGPFAGPGMSILDFGVKYSGYTTDVTLTFARGALSNSQERMLALTEKAYKLALSLVRDGASAREVAAAVDALFGKSRKSMPHSLGHGIGLEAHEAPSLRSRSDNTELLKPGMIFTLEPGLYDPTHGGCRLENDIFLSESGVEVLTNARIIRL
ncbi:MAG: Xaa-Pro peptidase family protein [Spirochaetaceae bacterium]|jgi:Xaa-Pro dipeptidase|nr:Xaa-Pro peptidase family protein [Spirochaetaceae bacterium]